MRGAMDADPALRQDFLGTAALLINLEDVDCTLDGDDNCDKDRVKWREDHFV